MRHLICDTGRTALVNGRSERIYLAWSDSGIAAGATFEVDESDLRFNERVCAEALTKAREYHRGGDDGTNIVTP